MKILIIGTGAFLPFIATSLEQFQKVVISPDFSHDGLANTEVIRADIREQKLHEIAEVGPEDIVIVSYDTVIATRTLKENILPYAPPAQVVVIGKIEDPTLERRVAVESIEKLGLATVRELRRRAKNLTIVNSIGKILKSAAQVALISYGAPDPDSIASAYALPKLFPELDPGKYRFLCTSPTKRPENIALIEILGIKYQTVKIREIPADTAKIFLDCQPAFFQEEAQEADVVIDHHPIHEKSAARVKDIRPHYGCTSSIICGYLEAANIPLDKTLATALYYGLITDTANFTRSVYGSEMRTFKFLYPQLDRNLLRSIQLSQMPAQSLDIIAAAITKRRVEGDILVSYVGDVPSPEIGAYAADMLILVKEVNWAVVGLKSDGKLYVFIRTSKPAGNAGKIAGVCFSQYGSAGGDKNKARAEIEVGNLPKNMTSLADWLWEVLTASLYL